MLRDRKIAVFIDVDNCPLQFINYENAFNEISKMGEIVCAKIYGVNERKHKDIVDHATNNGYDTLLGMRVKKRGAKVFDNRITADVLEAVFTMPNLDAVAIIAAPADMVYLYRMLHKYDVAVIAYDNGDEYTSNLIDEKLDIGVVELLPAPKKKAAPKAKKISDEANELLDKITKLREQQATVQPEANTVASQPQPEPTPVVEPAQQPVQPQEPVQEQPVQQQPVTAPVASGEDNEFEQSVETDADFYKNMQKSMADYDKEDASSILNRLNEILNKD